MDPPQKINYKVTRVINVFKKAVNPINVMGAARKSLGTPY